MADDGQVQISDLLERLANIPARISQATTGWSAERLAAAPTSDAWSARDVLAHLRAVDDIVGTRAYMLLARDNPPLVAFDERRWGEVAGYARADFHASLALFSLRIAERVAALRRVTPNDWARSGMHEERGTLTLLDIVRDFGDHVEEHCAQIEALANT